jgi:hypothetical protein
MDEAQAAVDELIVTLVKDSLVMKGRGTHGGAHQWVIPRCFRKLAVAGQIRPFQAAAASCQAATAL